jgi:magnesium transporter
VARYLEEHPPAAASSLIHAVPDALSARIFQAMLPYHAAKCFDHLPVETAAQYLSNLESRFAASILRYMRAVRQRTILGTMPPQAAARIAILLRYSHAVVGAWLNPTILCLPPTARIADAKARIVTDSYADYHRVYVVDAEHRPTGFVQMYDLLLMDDARLLSEFAQPLPPPLPANLSLDLALDHESWRGSDYLPVTDRAGQLVGILRYADLRAATTRMQERAAEEDLSGTLMDLAETCYLGLADVINTSLAAERASAAKGGS